MKEKENETIAKETTMKLKDILPCIAYGATLHLVETERGKKSMIIYLNPRILYNEKILKNLIFHISE